MVEQPERRAPVQGYAWGIPWSMHLRAYDAYCKKYGPQQALIEGGCRGGFGVSELDEFIPGWRSELSENMRLLGEIDRLTAELATLREKCLALEAIDSAAEVRAKAAEAELAEAKRLIGDLDFALEATAVCLGTWNGGRGAPVDVDGVRNRARTFLSASPPPPAPEPVADEDCGKAGDRGDDAMDALDMLDWFRQQGWMVAVHNDYRQYDRLNTFWLLTHPSGRWVKGEGVSDALALNSAMDDALAASPAPQSRVAEAWLVLGAQVRKPFAKREEAEAYAGNWGVVRPLGFIAAFPATPSGEDVDAIVTRLYRRFKDWSQRGFGPDDVTWCEVKADVLALLAITPAPDGVETLPPNVGLPPSLEREAEPVAWRYLDFIGRWCFTMKAEVVAQVREVEGKIEPLYAASPAPPRTEVGIVADPLDAFAKHIGWELSFQSEDEGEDYWAVHEVVGNINDREWNLIGKGDTPRDAIADALGSYRKGGDHAR